MATPDGKKPKEEEEEDLSPLKIFLVYVQSRVPYVALDSDGSESFISFFLDTTIQAFVDLFSLMVRTISCAVPSYG